MQHGETPGPREPSIAERQSGGISVDDLHVGPRQAFSQVGGQGSIALHRRETNHPPGQHVGGDTRSGSHLEHVITEILLPNSPRQQIILNQRSPLGSSSPPGVPRSHHDGTARHTAPSPGFRRS